MSRGTLRIGFVGAGMISQYYLQGWTETKGAEVVAICDPDLEKARRRAETFGIASVFSDLSSMLEVANIEAVDIATPVGTHACLVMQAADHGVHVMCQKPITPTMQEAYELIDYVGDRVRFMVHENYRFRPHYRQAREWITAGQIGSPLEVRLTMRSSGLVALGAEEAWLLARQPYLGKMPRLLIFETLIHHLDTLRSLIGEMDLKEGDLLPPERNLAKQFNVGRNALREAIKVLEIYGLVDRKTKVGTVIKETNLDHIISFTFAGLPPSSRVFNDIQAFRMVIEVGIAKAVLANVDGESIARLKELIEMMGATEDHRQQALCDFEFHATLVRLADNGIVSRIFEVLSEPIKRLMELGKGKHGGAFAQRIHRELVRALEAQDLPLYEKVMRQHLNKGRRFLADEPKKARIAASLRKSPFRKRAIRNA